MPQLNLAQTRTLGTGQDERPRLELCIEHPFVLAHLPSQTSDISVNKPLIGIAFVIAPAGSNLLAVIRAHRLLTAVHNLRAQKKAFPWSPFVSVSRHPSGCLDPPACSSISSLLQAPWSLMSESEGTFFFFNYLVWNWVFLFVKYLGKFLYQFVEYYL